MSTLVERDAALLPVELATPPALPPGTVQPLVLDADAEPQARLPNDHPAWARDVVTLSRRARELLGRLRPIAVRVFAAWEHRVRSILIGNRRVSIDPSGCYRAD
jgi:hypothetical protein